MDPFWKEFLSKGMNSRKVDLDEVIKPPLHELASGAAPETDLVVTSTNEVGANDEDHETPKEDTTKPHRSTRTRAAPGRYGDLVVNAIVENDDPATYDEAMMSPDSNKWHEAMKSKMESIYENQIWTLVELPNDRKAVDNKWIFKKKTDDDCNVTVYKARLVAKGFRQIQRVDYDETFSPVMMLKSIRIMLAIVAFFDYEIWQMDVKTAFLNGNIEEELYMVNPKVLLILRMLTMYANFSDQFMD
jgi:hypothetical protein